MSRVMNRFPNWGKKYKFLSHIMLVWPILFVVYLCNRRYHSNWCSVQLLGLCGRVWLLVAKPGLCITCMCYARGVLRKISVRFFGKSNA